MIADPSHAAGHRDLVPALARIAVAAGADGLIVEVHPNPGNAWSDGEQSLDFAEFDAMMAGLKPWIELRGMSSDGRRNGNMRTGLPSSCGGCAMRLPFAALTACVPVTAMLSLPSGLRLTQNELLRRTLLRRAAPVYQRLAELQGQERFPKGAQLLLVHMARQSPWWRDLRPRQTPTFLSTASWCCLLARRLQAIHGRSGN